MEFSASSTRALGPDPDEHDPLQAELAVLDLGDVLELGAQAGDPAELVPLGQVLLTGGEVLGSLGVRLVGVAADSKSSSSQSAVSSSAASRLKSCAFVMGLSG